MIGSSVEVAKQHLIDGKLVAIPTETVYGLAANALNPEAVSNIFKAKNRPSFDPLILHVDSLEKVKEIVLGKIPETAIKLANAIWPGPLTMVLPRKPHIPDLVTSGLETVAIRIPNHPLTLELLSKLDFPLAAPSANPFGYISPTEAQHVEAQLGEKTAYILDGGKCKVGLESTIISFAGEQPTVLRKGGLAIEELESLMGAKLAIREHSSSRPDAPGMLHKHYSPKVPFELGDIESLLKEHKGKNIATLSLSKTFKGISSTLQFVLSEKEDLSEAARNLFAYLRTLDQLQPDIILAELVPEEGLGRAINDRLRRAAAK
ncbi:L-threonylcarbamoyladenylate synthase [Flammeovirgaceae bacterium SG7u.111]|nr:L-threonylcarbamoyladenylate synthase [Flammeovirgaceae bacterium SG7u.132]WPO38508.1 L-threonylcarbamoyladenylate synthase [Flammeovirgaceae bacterium SG7u.111]